MTNPSFGPSNASINEVLANIPNYSGQIFSAKGKGRAIVSEPGNSDRVTIEFETDSLLSLLTIKNRIGISGSQMLVDQDSILIYYRIDKVAQKVSVHDGRLTSLNELASVNLLDLLNFKIDPDEADQIFESEKFYLIRFKNNATVTLAKENGLVIKVTQNRSSGMPYSRLEYESYAEVKGYTLPRKISILSAEGESKVVFQIRSLDINPASLNLTIDIPKNIPIQRI